MQRRTPAVRIFDFVNPASRDGSGPGVAMRRLAAGALAGTAVLAIALLSGAPWPAAIALGWDATALVFLASVWATIYALDAYETKRVARREDSSVAAADLILVIASTASLIAVAFVLVDAGARSGTSKGLYVALAVSAIVAAWASVHTVFTLRYARLYYADPIGGISFHSDDPPDYIDLAYIALTIGMTFQVSDTDLTMRPIRRAAARHALLSYLFGAVIVAVTINIVATLASS
jgi:uncharacterized membrane protein